MRLSPLHCGERIVQGFYLFLYNLVKRFECGHHGIVFAPYNFAELLVDRGEYFGVEYTGININ